MSIKGLKESDSSFWDSVAIYFTQNSMRHLEYMPGKDNYDVVWPFLFEVICNYLSNMKNIHRKICDFGCGTGLFSEKMNQIGFNVFACDTSKKMIDLACSSTLGGVHYRVGSLDFMQKYSPYDMITSIMVFQFIEHLEPVIEAISKCLEKNGILFFAVHNNEYVDECVKHNKKFRLKANDELPIEGEILIGDKWIKTYVRNSKWYDEILCSKGFIRLGYSFEGIRAPSCLIKSNMKWKSEKYYIAWYMKNST